MEEVGERGNPDAVHGNGGTGMKTVVSIPTHRGRVLPGPLVQRFGTIWTVRGFLLLQIATLLSMVSIHFGLLIGGYDHRAAGATELIIAAVLLAALLLTWMPAPWSRRPATPAPSLGNLGGLGGFFTIATGVGPPNLLDPFFYVGMVSSPA